MRFSCISEPQRNDTSLLTSTLPSQITWPPGRAAADHHHGIAMGNGAEIERGADAGHDAAADQAGAVEWNLLRHGDRLLIADNAVLAERSQEHQLAQLAAATERRAHAAIERD